MRRFGLIFILLLFAGSIFAQVPEGINYQGVARTADGRPLEMQAISLQVSILADGENSAAEYAEEHTSVSTNKFGLFKLTIGQGTPVTGLFKNIDWFNGDKWIEVQADFSGGTNYSVIGKQQLLSVPYAMYAKEAGNPLQAGMGIEIDNNTVRNTMPDQTVSLTGEGSTSIGGAYPNFLISSDPADADSDSTNEIQTLSKDPATRAVMLSDVSGDGGGTFTDEIDDADNDPVNEIQDLSAVLTEGNDAAGSTITNVGDPVSQQDVTTKNYVDIADANLLNALNTTYAFKASFSYQNTTAGTQSGITMPLNDIFDDFNVINGNDFVAQESATYVIMAKGGYTSTFNAQLWFVINGQKTTVPIYQQFGTTALSYSETILIKLNTGDAVSLEADNIPSGAVFNGEFFGFKL